MGRPSVAGLLSAGLLLTWVFTGSFGCTVGELQEGRYRCTAAANGSTPPGECPDEWFCHPDGLCYSTRPNLDDTGVAPLDMNVVAPDMDVPEPDMGTTGPLAAYDPCFAGFDVCEAGLSCRTGPTVTDFGQCSESCSSAASCPLVPGGGGVECVGGECLRSCTSDTDCDVTLECLAVVSPGVMPPPTVCIAVEDPAFDGRASCTSGSDCPPPAICTKRMTDPVGVCSWSCGPVSPRCPFDNVCVTTPAGASMSGQACLAPCIGNGECGLGLECLDQMGQRYCAPSTWAL